MAGPSRIEQAIYRFVVWQKSAQDPRSTGFLHDAHTLGLTSLTRITCSDLYFIEGDLSPDGLAQLADQLLYDPVTQGIGWELFTDRAKKPGADTADTHVIEVTLRPGVTDPVAGQIMRAAGVLEIPGVRAVSTGQRFFVEGDHLTDEDLNQLAARLLCNPIIQRFTLGPITPSFPTAAESTGQVEQIILRGCTENELMAVSQERRAALDLAEMKAIQAYCHSEERDLTDVEFETIAQTWSEHCVHKTFKARISLEERDAQGNATTRVIDNLFNHTIRAATRQINAPWVRSAFSDNAGIIEYDGMHEISFKVETHNHPSAIEPFGGANTGIGGVIRDVIGVSARPFAATDVLCFGPAEWKFDDLPAGVLHPRRIASGVVAGIQDYGNKIGIPIVNGAILYDPGYISNPLVFCGCVGIAPLDAHPRQPLPGDRVVVIGGRTGRDGLRGATFSSMTMDAQTGEVAGASVQIGAPIVEKGLIDVTLVARQKRLYHAITDCGAGGLSSAVGEMASRTGCAVQLDLVPLKYPGLAPWEIWLSEAQERMVLAVPPTSMEELRQICDLYEVELTDIGEFTANNRLVARYHERVILDLDNHFLHEGIPQRQLAAVLPSPSHPAGSHGSASPSLPSHFSCEQTLLDLLAHPNIASKETVVRVYDHEVQGGSIIKPLMGVQNDGPSDASLVRPAETCGNQAVVISAGINPEYGKLDPYQMAIDVIDEAIRNAVAIGADLDRLAILDNFCWGDPNNPETLGGLVAAALACRDAAVAYRAPFISGKDSFNNEYWGADGKRHAIPPSLLISAIGVMDDWSRAVSMDLKTPGDRLCLVGPFHPTLGGSLFRRVTGLPFSDGVPGCNPLVARAHYLALNAAMKQSLVRACHDLSEGGLAVAAAEMAIGGRLGVDLDMTGEDFIRSMFGETTGCFLVEVPEEKMSRFTALFAGLSCQPVGVVQENLVFSMGCGGVKRVDLPVDQLVRAWHSHAA